MIYNGFEGIENRTGITVITLLRLNVLVPVSNQCRRMCTRGPPACPDPAPGPARDRRSRRSWRVGRDYNSTKKVVVGRESRRDGWLPAWPGEGSTYGVDRHDLELVEATPSCVAELARAGPAATDRLRFSESSRPFRHSSSITPPQAAAPMSSCQPSAYGNKS
jgi:hypothetical protein